MYVLGAIFLPRDLTNRESVGGLVSGGSSQIDVARINVFLLSFIPSCIYIYINIWVDFFHTEFWEYGWSEVLPKFGILHFFCSSNQFLLDEALKYTDQ